MPPVEYSVLWHNANKRSVCHAIIVLLVAQWLCFTSGLPLFFSSTLTFSFFTFFKTFQSLRLGVRFKVSVWVSIRVSIKVSIRVIIRVSVRATVRVKARVRLRVYLLCFLHFCQAYCRQNLSGKIDTANNLS